MRTMSDEDDEVDEVDEDDEDDILASKLQPGFAYKHIGRTLSTSKFNLKAFNLMSGTHQSLICPSLKSMFRESVVSRSSWLHKIVR